MNPRRLSQAISEGDGISVIVEVDGPEAARDAQDAGAEAVVVQGSAAQQLPSIRGATDLPIVAHLHGAAPVGLEGADACLVDVQDDDKDELERLHGEIGDRLEVALRIENEDHLAFVLEEFDPEILVLGAPRHGDGTALEWVLELLPDVPAGKLAIADVGARTRDEVEELERAGVDGVIVAGGDVAHLVGTEPPDV
jgi:NAD(P)H-dependent flavin oxidoreductase YrpB (nitropropane dioxygenase family)